MIERSLTNDPALSPYFPKNTKDLMMHESSNLIPNDDLDELLIDNLE